MIMVLLKLVFLYGTVAQVSDVIHESPLYSEAEYRFFINSSCYNTINMKFSILTRRNLIVFKSSMPYILFEI